MAKCFLAGLALLVVLNVACAGKSVLVLLQNVNDADKYTSFFGSLETAGFQLTLKGYKDSGLKLREYGSWLYDDLVLFTPTAEGPSWHQRS